MATVTLLTLKETFWEFMTELYQGTATGGAADQVTDSGLIGYTSETWPTKIIGQQIRMTSGLASGDLRMVGKLNPNTGEMRPNRSFSAAVATNDTYDLYGSSINSGTPLTGLFNAVLRDLRPVTDTQITIVTSQRQYDVTTTVQTRRDIRAVYLRMLDPSGFEPHRIVDLSPGIGWWAYDRGGGGTTSVTLELGMALTNNTAINELWMTAETSFAAFTSDTSTVDAVYRDWLAWEAILEHTNRRLSLGTTDAARWSALQARAIIELQSHRERWLPGREPVRIATFP